MYLRVTKYSNCSKISGNVQLPSELIEADQMGCLFEFGTKILQISVCPLS